VHRPEFHAIIVVISSVRIRGGLVIVW